MRFPGGVKLRNNPSALDAMGRLGVARERVDTASKGRVVADAADEPENESLRPILVLLRCAEERTSVSGPCSMPDANHGSSNRKNKF